MPSTRPLPDFLVPPDTACFTMSSNFVVGLLCKEALLSTGKLPSSKPNTQNAPWLHDSHSPVWAEVLEGCFEPFEPCCPCVCIDFRKQARGDLEDRVVKGAVGNELLSPPAQEETVSTGTAALLRDSPSSSAQLRRIGTNRSTSQSSRICLAASRGFPSGARSWYLERYCRCCHAG